MGRQKEDLRTEIEKKAIEHYYEMSDGTKVRVLEFDLAKKPNDYVLFYIPGFATVFQSWEKSIELLSKDYKIYYFESREKGSAIYPNRKTERKNTLEKMAHDIKEVIEQMKLDDQKYVTLCSSTGGTIEVEALANKWLHPDGAIMIGPTIEYHMKFAAPFLIQICPIFVKDFFMPVFRWYMGKFYVDKKAYPKQYAKYVRAGEEAKIRRVRKVLWQTLNYANWEKVPLVEARSLLIGASEDTMHATEETHRVHKLMPNSTFIDLGTNIAAHSEPLVEAVNDFIKELEK
ncbi:MAG: alpha/beta hydrolase [Asgard group archaeon]|nr:alpha/beta hydrolase [Asgard group archaeon]